MSRARDLADGTFSGAFSADSPTFVVDDTNNRVGVGTASPSDLLELSGDTAQPAIRLTDADVAGLYHRIFTPTNTGLAISADAGNVAASSFLRFDVDGSEAARIASDGAFFIGKDTAGIANPGFEFKSNDQLYLTRDGGTPVVIRRSTNDGNFMGFYKDGTNVGSIGNSTTTLYITNAATTGLKIGANAFYSTDGSGSNVDNQKDVGAASARFDDVYATNPNIVTSDANEKQQIASLTDVEITAAKAISKLFKTFKWNDKVAEKGDAARTHTGVIAQEVQQAMTDAGLDAGNYAFFISSTWWEADETYTDDDGVEQTRTNTYDTAEEAPEGAVERTRLGIRYPELLSFIGAATEQRLASIEARLDALEAV